MTRGKGWLAIMAVFVLLSATAACGDDGGKKATGGKGGAGRDVKTDKGVDDKEIRVAVLNDFSGPVATIGTPAAVGTEIYFDHVNAEGGVCGRKVKVVRGDTMYDNQVTIQRYRAVKGDVVAITQLLGTSATLALANDIARDKIMTLAATGSAAVIPLKNVFIYITPFSIEAINAVAWAAKEQAGDDGKLQLGVIYQADPYGEEGLAAVKFAAKELGNVDVVATAKYAQTDQDFSAQVQAMEDAGAEVVYLHDTPAQTGGILGVAAQRRYKPLFIGNSGSFGSALVKPLGDLLKDFRVVTSSANWGEDVPEMKTFLAAAKKYAPKLAPDNFAVIGWSAGMVQRAALERACKDGDLTQSGVAAAMEGLKVDLNGMGPNLSYGGSPDERIPSREDRVSKIDLKTTFPVPLTDYFASDPAKAYTLPKG